MCKTFGKKMNLNKVTRLMLFVRLQLIQGTNLTFSSYNNNIVMHAIWCIQYYARFNIECTISVFEIVHSIDCMSELIYIPV